MERIAQGIGSLEALLEIARASLGEPGASNDLGKSSGFSLLGTGMGELHTLSTTSPIRFTLERNRDRSTRRTRTRRATRCPTQRSIGAEAVKPSGLARRAESEHHARLSLPA